MQQSFEFMGIVLVRARGLQTTTNYDRVTRATDVVIVTTPYGPGMLMGPTAQGRFKVKLPWGYAVVQECDISRCTVVDKHASTASALRLHVSRLTSQVCAVPC